MTPRVLYRTCSGLLAFFAVAHTVGMLQHGTKGREVDAVVGGMRTVHFDVMGASRTLWDFYFGFGMLLTVFLAFSAVLAWQLADLSQTVPPVARRLAGPFAALLLVLVAFAWVYFFLAPGIVSSLAAACALAAAWRLSRQ